MRFPLGACSRLLARSRRGEADPARTAAEADDRALGALGRLNPIPLERTVLLAEHLRHNPTQHVLMCTGDTSELVTLIDRGEIDLALVEGSFDHSAFEGEPLSSEPFVAVAA